MALSVEISPLDRHDFEVVASWLSDVSITRWLTSELRGGNITPSVVAIMVRKATNRLWMVRANGDRCGLVALSDVDRVDGVAMLWYLLGDRSFAGRGVTTTAVGLAVQEVFESEGLETIYAWIIAGNEGSRAVLKRNGFEEAGRLRSAAVLDGVRVDRIYFDLVKPSPI